MTKAKPKELSPYPVGNITAAIAGGRKSVETFVQGLKKEEVLPFLVQAMPVKKHFDLGVKLAESRVASDALAKPGDEWTDTATGIVYKWEGALGDAFVGDPVGLKSELLMLDVPEKDVELAVYMEPKVNFINLKNIENTSQRAIDGRTASAQDRARHDRIVETIKRYRDRKPNGPPHLKESD